MTLEILPSLLQRSDEWYDQRRGMLTASAVGKLITPKTVKVASNDTSRALIWTLAAERITGYTEPTFQSDDMMRGVIDEPIARDFYAEHRGVNVAEAGFMVRTIDGHRLGYSPDGLVGDDGLIEIKSAKQHIHLKTIAEDKVPDHHMAQCQTGLLVSGREWIDFISWCGGMPPFIKRVLPDERWQEAIKEALAGFEKAVAEHIETYSKRVEGLPETQRIDHFAGEDIVV